MTSASIIRWGRPAALLAAVVGVIGDAYHFGLGDREDVGLTFAYRAHGILLMLAMFLLVLALVRLALAHGERWGVLGRVGFLLALAGTITTFGDIWAETIVLPGVATGAQAAVLDANASGFHLGAVIFTFMGLFGLGWLLVAIASLRGGIGSAAAAGCLIPAAVIAALPVPGAYTMLLLAVAWLSWSLHIEDSEPALVRRAALR